MPDSYMPILFFAGIAFLFPIATLWVARLVRPESKDVGARREPYECGIPPEGDARGRFGVRFYIIALIFLTAVLPLAGHGLVEEDIAEVTKRLEEERKKRRKTSMPEWSD